MNQWKDFFGMTRRERRGTIVLLTVIALVLAVTALFRYCAPPPRVDVPTDDIERFEQQVDSLSPSVPASKTHKKSTPARKHRKAKPKQPKTPPQQRRLDPVPQI